MQSIGGMMAAWEPWERAMVPSLLSGAGTWTGITNTEVDRLDRVQDFFWVESSRFLSTHRSALLDKNDRDEAKNMGMQVTSTNKNKE